MRRRVVRPIHILAIVAATCVGGSSAAAQSIRDSTPERNVWVAGGLGAGTVSGALAADLGLWYTSGRVAFALHGTADDGFFSGEQREGVALLVGPTRSAAHRRIAGAVGVASVHSFVCGEDSGCDSGVRNVALAFAGEAFVHASVIGIGVDAFGALGARRASYAALALTLQLGWLGVAP